jgi:hypothetical protein
VDSAVSGVPDVLPHLVFVFYVIAYLPYSSSRTCSTAPVAIIHAKNVGRDTAAPPRRPLRTPPATTAKKRRRGSMIKPHGSDKLNPLYVADDAKRNQLIKEAEGLASIVVSSAAAGNAVMLGSGYFNPLTGFMNKADSLSVAANLKTTKGLFWPVPIVNMVKDAAAIHGAKRIAARPERHRQPGARDHGRRGGRGVLRRRHEDDDPEDLPHQ